jgi:TPR repeat protein
MKKRFTSPPLILLVLLTLGILIDVHGEEKPPSVINASPENQAEDQFRLGKAHAQGRGMDQSWEKSGFWYGKAAESGHTKAMVNLGLLYLEGKGTPKDEKMAYYWIHRAGSLGDPRAIGLEGYFLREGRGCSISHSAGLSLLQKGATLGDPFSQAMLGEQLLTSREKEPEAIAWLEKAAGSGNGRACLLLGDNFRARKTEQDRSLSNGWYEMGAWLGHPGCQYEYSRILISTGGATSAYPWAKLAKQGGVPAANGIYWECSNTMTAEQRSSGNEEAERIARLLP